VIAAVIARHRTFAVQHYVERALRARSEQGLPSAIEDDETLNKLALLMSAADIRPAAMAIDGQSSATDRQLPVHAAGRPAPLAEAPQRPCRGEGRPRAGANQTVAGLPANQQRAAGDLLRMLDTESAPTGARATGGAR